MAFLGLVGYLALYKTEGVEVGFCLFWVCLDIAIDTLQNMNETFKVANLQEH